MSHHLNVQIKAFFFFLCASLSTLAISHATTYLNTTDSINKQLIDTFPQHKRFDESRELMRILMDKCIPYVFLTPHTTQEEIMNNLYVQWCYTDTIDEMDDQKRSLIKSWFGGSYIDRKKLSSTVYAVIDEIGYTTNRKQVHDLLMETAAIESDLGLVTKQKGGPAQGIFQVIPPTEKYILKRMKKDNPVTYKKIMKYYDHNKSSTWNSRYNVRYNASLCLVYYYMATKYKLDSMIKTRAQRAALYKKKYNTNDHDYLIPRYHARAKKHLDKKG